MINFLGPFSSFCYHEILVKLNNAILVLVIQRVNLQNYFNLLTFKLDFESFRLVKYS